MEKKTYDKYIEKCIKLLNDHNGNILPGVHFMGTLGHEKYEIIRRATVGVANPTGKTETFCLSAVEFEACGVPVISYKGNGLLDTVNNEESGFLIRSDYQLVMKIVKLLRDNELNYEFGIQGMKYAERFIEDNIAEKWIKLFNEVENNQNVENAFSKKNMLDDHKWIRYLCYRLNRKIKPKKEISFTTFTIKAKHIIKKLLMQKI